MSSVSICYFETLFLLLLFCVCCSAQRQDAGSGRVDVGNSYLSYEATGEGFPLVLIHGGLMDRRMWDEQVGFFSANFRVIRYDVRGYGSSGPVNQEYSHVEDLRMLLSHLQVDKAVFLGLSLGGQVALDFLLEYPESGSTLVLAGSGLNGYPYQDMENLTARFEEIFRKVKENRREEAAELVLALPFFVTGQMHPHVFRRMRNMVEANLDVWASPKFNPGWPEPPAMERLESIRIPVLLLVGDRDVRDIRDIADTIERRVPGVVKKIIPMAGHHANMENPEFFNREVMDFLARLIHKQKRPDQY